MKIKKITQVAGSLPIRDPYIMASAHYNHYPAGNGKLAPKEKPSRSASWRMYHGDVIPGFPQHPHRGFEIATIVPEGYVDHFDSKGASGRYGNGDVQLMSVGSGVLHSEMFPMLNEDKDNPLRVFQIWINLPAKNKLTPPEYKMLWHEKIPVANLKGAKIKVILGEYYGVPALGALKHSWAADKNNHMGIALIEMEPDAELTLKKISPTMNRFLLHYKGETPITVEGKALPQNYFADLDGGSEITLKTGSKPARLLLLEGEPINEPVAAYGPFVMNSEKELVDAFTEYRRTEFGGWPWGEKESNIVHPKDAGRFSSQNFGKVVERPETVDA